jgi:hypothetical protein
VTRRAAIGVGAGLCALALSLACVDAEEVAALQAERDTFLEKTVPKDEYWREVTRKGTAIKALRGIPPATGEFAQRTAQAQSMAQAMEPKLPEVREINQRLADQLAQLRAKVAELGTQEAALAKFIGDEHPGEP